MNHLSKKSNLRKIGSSLIAVVLSILLISASITSAQAASSYISPATGLITSDSFLVSVYVESSLTEPEIAGANIKISYPANVAIVSINDGDFDSYIEKNDDKTLSQVSINAVNTAGNYKSGKVKLGSIRFEAQEATGQVQLQISSDSEVSGAGGEQLLTETINATYTLDLPESTVVDPVVDADATETTADVTTTKGGQAVPETGPATNIALFSMLSLVMIGLGVVTVKNPLK